jgi:hypothetical protein
MSDLRAGISAITGVSPEASKERLSARPPPQFGGLRIAVDKASRFRRIDRCMSEPVPRLALK